jgi:hypothetical protein
LTNFDAFDGRRDKLVIHSVDSLQIRNRDLLQAECPVTPSPRRTFRLFSVDGSHTAHHTINDIDTAFSVLRPGGIVIVDDFYNPHWPGAQEGVHAFLSDRKDISAVAYGENKLFLTRIEDHSAYLDLFTGSFRPLYSELKAVSLHGRPAVSFKMGDLRKHFDSNLRRRKWEGAFGASQPAGGLAVELGEGWSTPEKNGTWMNAPLALAKLHLPDDVAQYIGPLTVSLWVFPYLHQRRSTRTIWVSLAGAVSAGGQMSSGTVLRLQAVHTAEVGRDIAIKIAGDTPDIPAHIDPASTEQRALSFFVSRVEITLDC